MRLCSMTPKEFIEIYFFLAVRCTHTYCVMSLQPQSPNECLNMSICIVENRIVERRHPKNTKRAILIFFIHSLAFKIKMLMNRIANAIRLPNVQHPITYWFNETNLSFDERARNAEKSIENRMDVGQWVKWVVGNITEFRSIVWLQCISMNICNQNQNNETIVSTRKIERLRNDIGKDSIKWKESKSHTQRPINLIRIVVVVFGKLPNEYKNFRPYNETVENHENMHLNRFHIVDCWPKLLFLPSGKQLNTDGMEKKSMSSGDVRLYAIFIHSKTIVIFTITTPIKLNKFSKMEEKSIRPNGFSL